MTSTPNGLSPHRSRNRDFIACTAPRPSKTAPKQRAARMTHMNMQLTLSVFRSVSSSTFLFKRCLRRATMVVTAAPAAEHSTRLVTPSKNSPVMEKIMSRGMIPALSSRIFSFQVIFCRSSRDNTGPRLGFSLHRIAIYAINRPASKRPGKTPAIQSWPTGCRAIMP